MNRDILGLTDSNRDLEAKLENWEGKEHTLEEEIVNLKDKLEGKDTALKQVSLTMKVTSNENDRLKEMVDMFKQKLIIENCFHVTYGAQKVGGDLPQIKTNVDLIIGFVRDQEGAEEFYF